MVEGSVSHSQCHPISWVSWESTSKRNDTWVTIRLHYNIASTSSWVSFHLLFNSSSHTTNRLGRLPSTVKRLNMTCLSLEFNVVYCNSCLQTSCIRQKMRERKQIEEMDVWFRSDSIRTLSLSLSLSFTSVLLDVMPLFPCCSSVSLPPSFFPCLSLRSEPSSSKSSASRLSFLSVTHLYDRLSLPLFSSFHFDHHLCIHFLFFSSVSCSNYFVLLAFFFSWKTQAIL